MRVEDKDIGSNFKPPSWWAYPYVWMVLMGPALVVIAALWTAFIAIEGADHVLTGDLTPPTLSPAQVKSNHATSRTPTPDALSMDQHTSTHRGNPHE